MLLLFLLGVFPALTRDGFSQAQGPLNFANNFFVTGDYVVAGAYNMTSTFQTIGTTTYAVGTINVPDNRNMGIQGTKQVPKGGQIVAALLYWQTVEKVGVMPGQPGSGQNGFFRPVFTGGPAAPGYAISGTSLGGNNTVSWSSGGCTGGSTGKLLRTYRADVAGGLPLDKTGNTIVNGTAANGSAITGFEVRLPSVGNSTPLTLGATLVVIYRIPSGPNGPGAPLNSIVIYDGDFASGATQLTMTQQLHIYDADPNGQNAVTRVTHIVGNGKSNKFQTVYLGNGNVASVALPSLYGKNLPPFPGWYGTWDNPTWTFTSASQNPSNPIQEDSPLATTMVSPAASMQGCVSWGAVILSTTVKNSDKDGILDSWKTHQGYCDYLANPSCTGSSDTGWIDLPEPATPGTGKDVYLQYDYMCSTVLGPPSLDVNSCKQPFQKLAASYSSTDYSFDPRLPTDADGTSAVDKVVAAYHKHGINLHAIPGNAILESQPNASCLYSDIDTNKNPTCPFPNEPGTVGFGEGLAYIKNQTIDKQTGVLGCDPNPLDQNYDPSCVAVFDHGKKDSYHYALFSHGVGLPNWFLSDGSLKSVQQTGNTVIFTTSLPHGISQIIEDPKGATATDSLCPNGRVTVIFAVTNPNLNGTYCVLKSPAPTATTFAISVGGSSTKFTYTPLTDPGLSVANGQVTSMSGYSDVGGQNSIVSLGYKNWGPPNDPTADGNQWQNKAGTFMHELGHTMALTHGGTFFNNLGNNDYTPTYEANCKSNVQSSMSYMFQFDLLQVPGMKNAAGTGPLQVVDYSDEALPKLDESSPGTLLSGASYENTASFQLTSFVAPGSVLTLSSVGDSSGGSTLYKGTITGGDGNAFAGKTFVVAGFTNAANNGPFVAIASTGTTLTLSNASAVAEAHAATAIPSISPHCDGTPLVKTDQAMTYEPSSVSAFFWSLATGLDINFNGTIDVMHGHDEWDGTPAQDGVGPSPGVDLQQVSAAGTVTAIGPGGEPGGFKPLGGGGFKPLGGGGGLLFSALGGGGFKPLGGGGFKPLGGGGFKPLGGGGSAPEVTHERANSYTRPPSGLTATEAVSPRTITLNWFQPTFGQITQYNVYRSSDGVNFSVIATVTPIPPATAFPPTTYTDNPSCNSNGYSYKVTAFVTNDVSGAPQESLPTNVVSTGSDGLLTGCYTVTGFSSPANAVQGTIVPITWTLTDDFNTNGAAVNNLAANTLVAIGPGGTRTTLISKGVPTTQLPATFTVMGGVFTFNWDTDPFPSGSYAFELDLDSGPSQTTVSSALQLAIDINDSDSTPHIDTIALPDGVVGLAYSNTLTEHGGTEPFMWSFTGSLPAGIMQQAPNSPTLSGTTCMAGLSNLTATVTDSKSNSGTQPLTLRINQANTTTAVVSNANPSVFQQMVTFTVTVAPQYSCTPTGTVTLLDGGVPIASNLALSGGTAMFMTSALLPGVHSITANYSGDSNFNPSTSATLTQIVKAYTTTTLTSDTNPSASGQSVTFTATVAPVAPGIGTPTGIVTFLDGPAQVGSSSLSGGVATLMTSTLSVGIHTITASYGGDMLFVGSGSNSLSQQVNAVVTTIADSGAGSLRQAILDVNGQSSPKPIGIVFNISPGGMQTIMPSSALPTITQPTVLDATTQPGYAGTPIIELNGSGAGASVNGLQISAGNSTVKGLVIDRFSGDGILLDTSGGDTIQGNYIGTDVTGANAMPNGGNGIQIIDTGNNVVGGAAASARNLISGNTGEGVRIDGALATGNTIQGNYIGTDASGASAIGNNASGIYIRRAPGNSVLGNVVSGNLGFAGIAMCGYVNFCGGGDNTGPGTPGNNASGNTVQGNFVGTTAAGTAALGNNGAGVSIDGAPNTVVGGTAAGTPNTISYNKTNDVQIFDSGAIGNKIQGNTIQGTGASNDVGISVGLDGSNVLLTGNTLTANSISGHQGLGIDLAPAGVNANPSMGANNYPVISSATLDSGGTTTITGTLNSAPMATFTIEFFSSATCNASGNGEGALFLGSQSVTTDASGDAPISFSAAGLASGNQITTTSTDAAGTTSEFSACVAVTGPPPP